MMFSRWRTIHLFPSWLSSSRARRAGAALAFVCTLGACAIEETTNEPHVELTIGPPPPLPPLPAPPTATPGTAQAQFASVRLPAALSGPSVIGSYARGCLARAQQLPLDGAHWQVVRPSRNRFWGHPTLIAFITKLSEDASKVGWPGLVVGDLGQPRGGPAPSGHASHQIGLDVDIFLQPMPDHRMSPYEREGRHWGSVIQDGTTKIDPKLFGPSQAALIKQAALSSDVTRIFVHPAIKKELCTKATGDRSWLGKVRPWFGHDDHMHVRLRCPPGETRCVDQNAPPAGDGCGGELASWFKNGAASTPIVERRRAWPMSSLPDACRQVVSAPPTSQTASAGQP